MSGDSILITYSTTKLSVKEVIDRIETILKEKNVTIFCRISHSQAAHDAGLTMQDEELIIFGNPKVGTPLMIESPAIGIELPLKVIAWGEDQKTMLAHHDLDKLASTFHIKESINTINQLKIFMANLVESVIK